MRGSCLEIANSHFVTNPRFPIIHYLPPTLQHLNFHHSKNLFKGAGNFYNHFFLHLRNLEQIFEILCRRNYKY